MMVTFSMGLEMELVNIVMTIRFGMGVGSMINKMVTVIIMKMDI